MPAEIQPHGLPFEEAIAFFRQKLDLPTQAWRDLEGAAHDHAFAVAGAMRMDLLADLRAAVDAALADGETLEDFRRRFDEVVQRHGWDYKGARGWRTRTIYMTNLRTAYAAGRQAQQRHPRLAEKRPYWWYRHGGSMEPRKEHVSPPPHGFNGLVLHHTDPFWQTHYPPNGWGCSCKVFTLSAEEAAARGLTVREEAPDLGTYEEVDRKTGEIVELPRGVGLGWDHAPGAGWIDAAARAADRTADLAADYVRELVGLDGFRRWLASPEVKGAYPVGVIDQSTADAISARPETRRVVRLSEETMEKQRRRHPELDVTHYRLLPDLIERGEVIRDTPQTVIILERRGRLWKAVVKATRTGKALFLQTLHQITEEEVAGLRARGAILRGGR